MVLIFLYLSTQLVSQRVAISVGERGTTNDKILEELVADNLMLLIFLLTVGVIVIQIANILLLV